MASASLWKDQSMKSNTGAIMLRMAKPMTDAMMSQAALITSTRKFMAGTRIAEAALAIDTIMLTSGGINGTTQLIASTRACPIRPMSRPIGSRSGITAPRIWPRPSEMTGMTGASAFRMLRIALPRISASGCRALTS